MRLLFLTTAFFSSMAWGFFDLPPCIYIYIGMMEGRKDASSAPFQPFEGLKQFGGALIHLCVGLGDTYMRREN